MSDFSSVRLAYLVSRYPTIGHSFLLREIRFLRAAGFDILTVSIRPADRSPEQLTAEEHEEWTKTRVVTKAGLPSVAAIHLRVLLARPAGYMRGAASAARLAGLNLRRWILHSAYFGEAVVAGFWMEQSGYRHVHSHFTSTVALFIKRVFGFQIVLTLHGPDEFSDPVSFGIAEKIEAATLVRTISEFGCSEARRYSNSKDWGKIEALPLGIDPEVFAPRPFRTKPDVFRLACVGRLAPVKGIPVLLTAVNRLVKEGRRVSLRIAGEGPSRAEIEARIAELGIGSIVKLEGNLSAPQVLELYRETDIFTLASYAEGLPTVLMEAMAMEIPCVATRVMGNPEIIEDGVTGLLVTAGNADELAVTIARLMDDEGLRFRLGQAGRRKVLERYNLQLNLGALADRLHVLSLAP